MTVPAPVVPHGELLARSWRYRELLAERFGIATERLTEFMEANHDEETT